jgi:hypothetical protein
MTTRREINEKHELAVLAAGVKAHNDAVGEHFRIVERPDPPDAIIEGECGRSWMEHTDAFFPGFAEDLTSYAASDKEHKPMREGLYANMDATFAPIFVDAVLKKFGKPGYRDLVKELGPGVLVVGCETPWFDQGTIDLINREWRARGSPDISVVFSHVYLAFCEGGKNRAIPWERA